MLTNRLAALTKRDLPRDVAAVQIDGHDVRVWRFRQRNRPEAALALVLAPAVDENMPDAPQ